MTSACTTDGTCCAQASRNEDLVVGRTDAAKVELKHVLDHVSAEVSGNCFQCEMFSLLRECPKWARCSSSVYQDML